MKVNVRSCVILPVLFRQFVIRRCDREKGRKRASTSTVARVF